MYSTFVRFIRNAPQNLPPATSTPLPLAPVRPNAAERRTAVQVPPLSVVERAFYEGSVMIW
jgi:hypothetical protein